MSSRNPLSPIQPAGPRTGAGSDPTIVDATGTERTKHDRSYFVAIITAAVIIAGGNLVIFISLPWTQATLFGAVNPAVWLTLGLLVPAFLICISVYQVYWQR